MSLSSARYTHQTQPSRVFILLSAFVMLWCLMPMQAYAVGSSAGALSDPAGTGKPNKDNNPALSDLSTRIFIHGYYRLRSNIFHNFDLGRGPTPSTKQTIFPKSPSGASTLYSSDMRFRTEITFEIARSVRVITRIDALDNLVLGSTPMGFPRDSQIPMIAATQGQTPPSAGFNSVTDSIRIKRAYGEVLLPIGYVMAGRMGALAPWGLGMLVQGGNRLDADNGDAADRITLVLPAVGHLWMVAYELSASGPVVALPNQAPVDQEPHDGVRSWGFAVARYDSPEGVERKLRAGWSVLNYGLIASYRYQDLDAPNTYINLPDQKPIQRGDLIDRGAWSLIFDFWFLFRRPWLRIELEAVYAKAEIRNGSLIPGVNLTKPVTSDQFGGVLQVAVSPLNSRWGFGLEFGLASGDSAPGFGVRAPNNQVRTVKGDMDGPQLNYPKDTASNNLRFHPDYRVDQIFWRRIVGQVTDAIYVKAAGHFDLTPRTRLWTSVIYSRAMEASTPPGGVADLGVEWDTGIRYEYDPGFEFRLVFGAFFPFAGLHNPALTLNATSAFSVSTVLGYVF